MAKLELDSKITNSKIEKGEKRGILYLCATPIGNLEDITLRAKRMMSEVDLIAAEDTRKTIKLLNHFNINTQLTSYHEHNKREKGERLIKLLKEGKNILLVSDAGTPGISDPGTDLVKSAIKENIYIDIIPGATACISALAISGLSTERFTFEGFLPRDKKGKKAFLENIKNVDRTIVIYEAPHRLFKTLEMMLDILGNRKIAVARELTKLYQEIFRGDIVGAINKFKEDRPRGEFTLVIEGYDGKKEKVEDKWEGISVKEHILMYMKSGKSKRDAVKLVAIDRNLPRNQVYKSSIEIKET